MLARLYRVALEHLGVEAQPKVTGKRGVQIWVPVTPTYSFDQTRDWVEKISRAVGQMVPELVSWKWHTSERGGLARLDYTQNAINKTLVAPFSARPAAGAPVSVPIGWDELDDPELTPDRWTVRTVLDRLAGVGRPDGPPHRDGPGAPRALAAPGPAGRRRSRVTGSCQEILPLVSPTGRSVLTCRREGVPVPARGTSHPTGQENPFR